MTPLSAMRALYHLYTRFGMPGVRAEARARLTGNEVSFPVRPPGFLSTFYLRCGSSDISTYEQVFIGREYDFATLREPRHIIDAGANIGLASIFFCRAVSFCKNFCHRTRGQQL